MSPWPVDPQELEGYGWRGQPVTLPRPGHADLAGVLKYGHDDVRNVLERASARETAGRVAAGAVAKALITDDRHHRPLARPPDRQVCGRRRRRGCRRATSTVPRPRRCAASTPMPRPP